MDNERKHIGIVPILLVIIVLTGTGVGAFYFGNKYKKCDKCTECKDSNDNNKSDEKSKIAYGTDTNTSGKTVADTKTKNVTLNGDSYEFKIEVLNGSGEQSYIKYQNVYFNGHKFISDEPILKLLHNDEYEHTDAKVNEQIEKEMNGLSILKDSENGSDYLVFNEKRYATIGSFYVYVLSPSELLAKLFEYSGDASFSFSQYNDCVYCNSATIGYYDYITYLDNEEIMDARLEARTKFTSIQEYKFEVKNGAVQKSKARVLSASSGWTVEGAGAI